MLSMFKKLRGLKSPPSPSAWSLGSDYNSTIGLHVYGNLSKFGQQEGFMTEEQGYLWDLWYNFHVPLAELFEKCIKLS